MLTLCFTSCLSQKTKTNFHKHFYTLYFVIFQRCQNNCIHPFAPLFHLTRTYRRTKANYRAHTDGIINSFLDFSTTNRLLDITRVLPILRACISQIKTCRNRVCLYRSILGRTLIRTAKIILNARIFIIDLCATVFIPVLQEFNKDGFILVLWPVKYIQ